MALTERQQKTHVDGTIIYMKRVWPHWFRAFEEATSPGSCVLSAGCGTGGMLRRFGHAKKRFVGCDLDVRTVKAASWHYAACAADVCQLPFRANVFDYIVSEWVFEHLPDKPRAVAELERVLKPKGRIAVLTTNPHSPLAWTARLWPRLGSRLRKTSLGIEETDTFETDHTANSVRALTRLMGERDLRRVALYRISHMEFYFIHLSLLRPLAKLHDLVFRLPPFSLLSNAYLAVFQKGA